MLYYLQTEEKAQKEAVMSQSDPELGARYKLPYLRAWRRKKFMSMRDLKEASGVSTNTLTLLENQRSEANPGTVGKLARGLGITPDELVYTNPLAERSRHEAEEENKEVGALA